VSVGYGLLQVGVLPRLTGWIRTQRFSLSYWGFSLGLATLGWCLVSLVPHNLKCRHDSFSVAMPESTSCERAHVRYHGPVTSVISPLTSRAQPNHSG
jgi:hypothetical protein